MPDRRRTGRVAAALSAGALTVLLAGPTAWAQVPSDQLDPGQQPPAEPTPEEPEQHPPGSWGASTFEAPFDEPDATVRDETFDVAGTLRYQKTGPADHIQQVEVRIVDDPADSFAPGEACTLPAPTTVVGDGPRPDVVAEQAFEVLGVQVPCNGRYLVEAEGRLDDPDAAPHTMRQTFVLAVPPRSITGLSVNLDGEARSVTATFQPLPADRLAPDAIGYVLERSEPDGTFVDVASIGVDDEPRIVDPLDGAPAGTYTYRVRAVRAGAAGEVRSDPAGAESDTVDVPGDPASTASPRTTAKRRSGTGARPAGRVPTARAGSASRPTTSTTLDTGFEDTLDYGPGGQDELGGDEPVAGQSIVRDEGTGAGLAVPAAGALVMMGWAGHILYLNRLAKQL